MALNPYDPSRDLGTLERFQFEQSLDEWARIDAQMDGQESMLRRILHPVHTTPLNDRLLSIDIWNWHDRTTACLFCGHDHESIMPEWRLSN